MSDRNVDANLITARIAAQGRGHNVGESLPRMAGATCVALAEI